MPYFEIPNNNNYFHYYYYYYYWGHLLLVLLAIPFHMAVLILITVFDKVDICAPIYRCENWGSRMLDALPKVKEIVTEAGKQN